MSYPELVQKVAVIAATSSVTAQAIAFNEVARQTIMLDPAWLCGDYLPGQGPAMGLAVARMLAMITYQSEEAMEQRFGRNPSQRPMIPSPTHNPDFATRFDVEGYLYHQGDALARRFELARSTSRSTCWEPAEFMDSTTIGIRDLLIAYWTSIAAVDGRLPAPSLAASDAPDRRRSVGATFAKP